MQDEIFELISPSQNQPQSQNWGGYALDRCQFMVCMKVTPGFIFSKLEVCFIILSFVKSFNVA